MFDVTKKEIVWGGRTLTLETGRVARQADGAVLVSYGGTQVLCTAVAARKPREGVDFFPLGDGSRFLVAAAGTIEFVELWQNGENWQVNVLIRHNERYSSEYGFEPMSGGAATGQAQLARVAVCAGQEVSQGDLLGLLSQVGEGAHVHFRVRDGPESVCPSDLFTEEAQASILRLLHTIWPGATICS